MNKILIVLFSVSAWTFVGKANAGRAIPEPKSWSYPEVIEYAKEIAPKNIEGKPFNKFGHVYSIMDENRVDRSSASANELQKYADVVYHAFPDASAERLPKSCKDYPANISFVYLAGIAYISHNAVDKTNREWAEKCLEEIQNNIKKENAPKYVSINQLQTTLENIVLCKESMGVVLANKKRYLARFNKNKGWYVPKDELKVFGGKVLKYYPVTAGMSPGATVVVDLDFDTAKNRVQKALGVIFDRCENKNNMKIKYCSKKQSTGKTIGVFKSKASKYGPWVSTIACIHTYVK